MGGVNYKQGQSSQITKRGRIFLGVDDFRNTGTATLTRTGKGNWNYALGNSATVVFMSTLRQILSEFSSSVINYQLGVNPNGAMSINSAAAIYSVAGLALTTGTLGISQAVFPASGVATVPTVTDLIAPTNLTLATNANLYNVTVTPANPSLLVLATGEQILEVAMSTGVTGTAAFYGVLLDLMYTY